MEERSEVELVGLVQGWMTSCKEEFGCSRLRVKGENNIEIKGFYLRRTLGLRVLKVTQHIN